MYCEIGNWIAMDRRFSEMDSEEVDEFYETMEELLNEINEDEAIEEVFTSSMNTAVERVDEINELNHLFYEK
jgi:glycine cleavage system protein P-like pyridoxal-binding family